MYKIPKVQPWAYTKLLEINLGPIIHKIHLIHNVEKGRRISVA